MITFAHNCVSDAALVRDNGIESGNRTHRPGRGRSPLHGEPRCASQNSSDLERTMTKIAFIGAGSTVFAQKLLGDILAFPSWRTPRSFSTTSTRSGCAHLKIVGRKIARQLGATPTIEATTDRRRALDGADFVLSMFLVGGFRPATMTDFEIPKKYGLQPDHRRHARDRRDHARAAHHPGAARPLPGHGSDLPGRDLPQLRQPDGDELLGDQPRQHHLDRRPLPQRAAHRPSSRQRSRRAAGGGDLPGRRHQPHGLLSEAGARRPGPLPATPRVRRERPGCRSAIQRAADDRVRYERSGDSAISSPNRASTSPSMCPGSSSATGRT